MNYGIEAIEYYLPEGETSSAELAHKFGFDQSFIEGKVGVKKLFLAAPEEFSSDLATKAVEKLFAKDPTLRETVDAVVVCTQTPDYPLPHTSAIVHQKLKLPSRVACFDVSLGCSGWVYGLSILQGFLRENQLSRGLLITSETYSKMIDPRDRDTKVLFSDAAAVTLVGRNGVLKSGRFTFGTNGNLHEHLIYRAKTGSASQEPRFLEMNGRGIFEFVGTEIPKDVQACLEANETHLDAINFIVFHQASSFMLETVARRMRLKADDKRFVKVIDRFGNTVSSSIPIALRSLWDTISSPNTKILVSGFGVGLSWASTILESSLERNQ